MPSAIVKLSPRIAATSCQRSPLHRSTGPVALTVATLGLDDAHVARAVTFCVAPSASWDCSAVGFVPLQGAVSSVASVSVVVVVLAVIELRTSVFTHGPVID